MSMKDRWSTIEELLDNFAHKLFGGRRGREGESAISSLAVGCERLISLVGTSENRLCKTKDATGITKGTSEEPLVNIEGIGTSFPRGLNCKENTVTDKKEFSRSIGRAISQARRMADRKGYTPKGVSLYLSVCGSVTSPERAVGLRDDLPPFTSVIEENQYYTSRLMDSALAEEIVQPVTSLGADVEEVVFEPFATGKALLTEEEKIEGVVLVDIGKAFTDVALYKDGHIACASSIPHAGRDISEALMKSFGLEFYEAEVIKGAITTLDPIENEGGNKPLIRGENAILEANDIAPKKVVEIVRAEISAIFDSVFLDLDERGLDQCSKMVLSGNSSLLKGIESFVGDHYGFLARRGDKLPCFSGLGKLLEEPQYHSSLGLLKYGLESDKVRKNGPENRTSR